MLLQIPKYAAIAALFCASLVASAFADQLEVFVQDAEGNPVPDVAVYATFQSDQARDTPGSAVMDQMGKQFVPHVLVVQVGTSVEFPNSDVVAHHVYSFSKPNNFALPLYKGDAHAPITFHHDGIVTLGCNIHDHMLAYIVVVDTDVFGKTDADGRVTLEIPGSNRNGSVHIWSPRIRDAELTQELEPESSTLKFALSKKLRPAYDAGSEAIQWSGY